MTLRSRRTDLLALDRWPVCPRCHELNRPASMRCGDCNGPLELRHLPGYPVPMFGRSRGL